MTHSAGAHLHTTRLIEATCSDMAAGVHADVMQSDDLRRGLPYQVSQVGGTWREVV